MDATCDDEWDCEGENVGFESEELIRMQQSLPQPFRDHSLLVNPRIQ